MKKIVLLSGGLDSATCLAKAIEQEHGYPDNVKAVSVRYGQRHSREVQCAKKLSKHYGVELFDVDLSACFDKNESCALLNGNGSVPHGTYASQKEADGVVPTAVPFRNGLFVSAIASFAMGKYPGEGIVVVLGVHRDDCADDAYADCSADFITKMAAAVYEGSGGVVNIETPFLDKTKADIVCEGLRLGVPYELTWSCYEGGDKPCGECATCLDRAKAFELNGAIDPAL